MGLRLHFSLGNSVFPQENNWFEAQHSMFPKNLNRFVEQTQYSGGLQPAGSEMRCFECLSDAAQQQHSKHVVERQYILAE